MPRKVPEIKLSDAERAHLEKLSRSHSAERRMMERATIILACAAGLQNQQIASDLGVSTVRVGKWRSRFSCRAYPVYAMSRAAPGQAGDSRHGL